MECVNGGKLYEFVCRQCHNRMSLRFARFLLEDTQGGSLSAADLPDGMHPAEARAAAKKQRDRAAGITAGASLPQTGSCKHYKMSHRWLRFPCCGNPYACDVCHDQSENHPPEVRPHASHNGGIRCLPD